MLNKLSLVLVILFVLISNVRATTIVSIKTDETVVLGADRKETFVHKTEMFREVCKIYQVNNYFFSISGLTHDPKRNFHAPELVAHYLKNNPHLSDTIVNTIVVKMKEELLQELALFKKEDKTIFNRTLKQGDGGGILSVIIVGFESYSPFIYAWNFSQKNRNCEEIDLEIKKLFYPKINSTATVWMGEVQTIEDYLKKSPQHINMSPEDAVDFLINLEIKNKPEKGDIFPIDLLKIDRSGTHWIRRQQNCPVRYFFPSFY